MLCLGSTGIARPTSDAPRMTRVMYSTRVRNTARLSCMPAMIRWPSMTASGSAENESSSSTMSATARVAWLPLCIEMPSCACLSDRMSLTPSPTMATHSPFWRSVPTRRALSDGGTRPNTERVRTASASSAVVHRLQLQSRDGLAVQAQADLPGERRHGHRVVARDELQGHAGIGEPGQGRRVRPGGSAPGAPAPPSAPGRAAGSPARRRRTGTRWCRARHANRTTRRPWPALSATSRSIASWPPSTGARCGPRTSGAPSTRAPARSPSPTRMALQRSSDENGTSSATATAARRPGSARGWRPTTGSGATSRPRTIPASGPAPLIRYRMDLGHLDLGGRQGAGLVEAQDAHPAHRLDRVGALDERLLAGQPDDGHGVGDRDHDHQALRDERDQHGGRARGLHGRQRRRTPGTGGTAPAPPRRAPAGSCPAAPSPRPAGVACDPPGTPGRRPSAGWRTSRHRRASPRSEPRRRRRSCPTAPRSPPPWGPGPTPR